MAEKSVPELERITKQAAPEMPDLAAREPAEGDLDQIDRAGHLCCPDEPSSSGLPVESGALIDQDLPGKQVP